MVAGSHPKGKEKVGQAGTRQQGIQNPEQGSVRARQRKDSSSRRSR